MNKERKKKSLRKETHPIIIHSQLKADESPSPPMTGDTSWVTVGRDAEDDGEEDGEDQVMLGGDEEEVMEEEEKEEEEEEEEVDGANVVVGGSK